MNTERDCARCAFAVKKLGPTKDTLYRDCHRHPPMFFMQAVAVKPSPANPQGILMAPSSAWPPVNPGQWCGEFQAAAD